MNLLTEFLSTIHFICLCFISVLLNIDSFFNTLKPYPLIKQPLLIQLTPLSEEEQFNENIKSKFLELIANNNNNNNNKSKSLDYTQNIDEIFYNKTEFSEYMKNPDTQQESIWKSRIQMISTPRGNVIMFYDAYKLGFAYYCDQNVVSYDILNSCAMKYVMTYRCLDFFIDEYVLPEYESNTKLKAHYLDEPKKQQLVKDKTNKNNLQSPFLKPKNINRNSEKAITHNKEQEQTKLRNKFIYLGNIRNFIPCQKEKKTVVGFASVLLDGIDNKISWNSYKNNIKG